MRSNALPTLFFVTVFGVVLWAVLAFQRRRAQRLEEVLRGLAARVNGQIEAGHWLVSRPSLLFGIRALPARIEFYSTGGKHPTLYTDLMVNLAGQPRFPVKLAPEGFLATVGKLFGLQDVQIGDESFDPLFSIQSSDEVRLRAFLTPRVRGAMMALRRLEGSEHVWVGLEGSELRVRKLSWMDEEDRAVRFLEQATRVVEGYLDAIGAAAPERIEPASQTSCPVCRDGLPERVATCPGCGARHHPECFELNDGCGRCGAKAPRAGVVVGV